MKDKLARNYPANYDAHARSVAADAYWKQVRRTIDGEAVSEAQIMLIVNAVTDGLSLEKTDVVLDLACGNGALSSYLFDRCAGLVGVDVSPYLIDIATKVFARPPSYRFCVQDAVSYLKDPPDASTFSKVLIYGAYQYFSKDEAAEVLNALKERFAAVTRVFIGNIPNKQHVRQFYREAPPTDAELNDHEARIGIWYFPEEFKALAQAAGWQASLSYMPTEFYASNYRFDAILQRPLS